MGTLPLPPTGREGFALPGDGHSPRGTFHGRLPGVGERPEAVVRPAAQQGHVQSAEAAGAQVSYFTYSRRTPFAL